MRASQRSKVHDNVSIAYLRRHSRFLSNNAALNGHFRPYDRVRGARQQDFENGAQNACLRLALTFHCHLHEIQQFDKKLQIRK